MHLVRDSIQRKKWKMLLTVALTAQCVELSSPPKVNAQRFTEFFVFFLILCNPVLHFRHILQRNYSAGEHLAFF